MNMTKTDFKVWLVTNGYTQKLLAEKLGLTEATIVTYNRNGRYPIIFQYALRGLLL